MPNAAVRRKRVFRVKVKTCSVLELKTNGHHARRIRSEPPYSADSGSECVRIGFQTARLSSYAACVTVLPPRFKKNHGDGVGKVHTPAAGLHGQADFLRGGQAVEDVGRQSARFRPEQ